MSREKKKPLVETEYVIPLGNGWVVKNSQTSKFTLITDTQREAIGIARAKAKAGHRELIVYGKDGKIREKISYAKPENLQR